MKKQTPRHLLRVLPVVLMVLALVSLSLRADGPPAPAKATKRLFWKVTSPTTEVYLLGSIHVATPGMYPLPPEIEAAFAKSDVLMVEADITKADQAALQMQLMSQGMYPQGDSLQKHLTPETATLLQNFCKENGLPFEILGTMKPFLASAMVESTMYANAGLTPDNGIDLHFLNAANKAKTPKIVELESVDAQMKLILGLDDNLANRMLEDTFKDDSKAEIAKIVKVWNEGDVAALEKEMADDEKKDADSAKLNDLMIYQRNGAMIKKIDEALKGKEKVFVTVGAAHLIGEKGVVKGLTKLGYKVEIPGLTEPAPAAATTAN
jgi:uncharacterized protein YbaP (TraB family)